MSIPVSPFSSNSAPHSFWLILTDLLLWAIILVGLGWLGIEAYQQWQNQARQTVVLDFYDANEVTVGANVRMMGVDIGYVDRIELGKNQVRVTVKTEAGVVPIPRGTTATILYTGIGGAKSLELEPPQSNSLLSRYPHIAQRSHWGTNGLLVEEPIRQIDNMRYMLEIAESLREGAENFSNFFGREEATLSRLNTNLNQAEQSTAQATLALKASNQDLAGSLEGYERIRPDILRLLGSFNVALEEAVDVSDKTFLAPTTYNVLQYVSVLFDAMSDRLDLFFSKERLLQVQVQADGLTTQLRQATQTVQTKGTIWSESIERSRVPLSQMEQQIIRWSQSDFSTVPSVLQHGVWVLKSLNQSMAQSYWFSASKETQK